MKVKTVDGHEVEITMDEAKYIHDVMAGKPAAVQPHHFVHQAETRSGHHAGKHAFHIDGKEVFLSPAEMKIIADIWWENYGKNSMKEFFERYHRKAGKHIAAALGFAEAPASEKDVKGAIARAVSCGNPDVIAEVVFEAMEWQTAYAGLKSIEG